MVMTVCGMTEEDELILHLDHRGLRVGAIKGTLACVPFFIQQLLQGAYISGS